MGIESTRLHEAFAKLGPVISEKTAGKNLLSYMEKNVENHPRKAALYSRVDEKYDNWESINWKEYLSQAHLVASACLSIGIKDKDICAIISRNKVEHNVTDMGILYAGGISSSLYPTLKSEQLHTILDMTKSPIIFVDHAEILDEIRPLIKKMTYVKCIVTFDCKSDKKENVPVIAWRDFLDLGKKNLKSTKNNISTKVKTVQPHDLACILFTSGTTGKPKGVPITHENILWTIESYFDTTGIVNPEPRMVSYLPMAHITERVAHHYHIIARLGQLYFALEVTDLKLVLPHAKPTLFFAVPRVWEKFHNAMLDKIHHSDKENLILRAIDNGMKKVVCEQMGQPIPLMVSIKNWIFNWLIFSKMKSALGLDKTEVFGSGAAPLSPEVQKFFHAISIPVTEVYGLTENSGPSLSNYPVNRNKELRKKLADYGGILPENTNAIGTVGYPIPGARVKISKDGEILLKGKHLFKEYYENAEATEKSFTNDGWFKTGDIGKLLDNGMFQVIARKKELIITSGGKNIAPVEIENHMKKLKLIGGVCVIGDKRHYLTALITINHEGGAQTWAKQHHIHFDGDIDKLVNHPEVKSAIGAHIQKTNSYLARVQQIKKFTLLKNVWGPETGELTPTLKLKRFYISQKYQDEIEAMYQDETEHKKSA